MINFLMVKTEKLKQDAVVSVSCFLGMCALLYISCGKVSPQGLLKVEPDQYI